MNYFSVDKADVSVLHVCSYILATFGLMSDCQSGICTLFALYTLCIELSYVYLLALEINR